MNIYLAAMESYDFLPLITKNIIKNAFFSFYYLRNKKTPDVLINSRKHIKNIIVDSGAHTFFSEMQGAGLSVSVHTKKSGTKETPEEYWKKYVNWVEKYQDYFDYFVELDIGEIVGQKRVLEWREELKQKGLYKKCITVYHPNIVTMDEYIEMLGDSHSKYVALEGDRPSRPRLNYNQLIKPAYERGVKVHGFAFCKKTALIKYPFYSVDSTGWKAGVQYGRGLVYNKKGIKSVEFKKPTSELFSLAHKTENVLDINAEDKRTQRLKRLELAIYGYEEMERYLTDIWNKRGIVWKD